MTYEYNLFGSGDEDISLPDREPVRLILISSVAGVRENIHRLHLLNYREATTWSPTAGNAQPTSGYEH